MRKKNLIILNGLLFVAIVIGLVLNMSLITEHKAYKEELEKERYATAKVLLDKKLCMKNQDETLKSECMEKLKQKDYAKEYNGLHKK